MSSDASRPAGVPTAEQLRMSIISKEMAEMEKHEKQRAKQEEQLRAFTESFLHDHVSDDERAMIQKLVMNAVKNGKFEALVYSFPSDLCTDSGRAINNRLASLAGNAAGQGQGALRPLPGRRQAAGLQAEGDDHQLSGRHAGGCRLLPELGAGGKLTYDTGRTLAAPRHARRTGRCDSRDGASGACVPPCAALVGATRFRRIRHDRPRRPILDPISRLSEIMFGLLMTLTFTGTMSVAIGGGDDVRSVLFAALAATSPGASWTGQCMC